MNEVSTVTETPVVHPDLAIPAEFKRDETNGVKNGKKKEVVQVAEDLGTPEVLH